MNEHVLDPHHGQRSRRTRKEKPLIWHPESQSGPPEAPLREIKLDWTNPLLLLLFAERAKKEIKN